MERHQHAFLLIFSIIIFLGLVFFVSCIIAETKKAKEKDIKLDNKLCYLPQSHALGFGIAAVVCLIIAQIIGNLVIYSNFCSRRGEISNNSKARKPTIATILLFLSWISFGLAVTLLSASTSMSRMQPYGKGWLDHECYMIKDGVYTSSGALALVTTAATVGSAIFKIRSAKAEGQKIHAQVG